METINDFGGFEIADDGFDFFSSVDGNSIPAPKEQKNEEPTNPKDGKKEDAKPQEEESIDDGTFLPFGETKKAGEKPSDGKQKSFKEMNEEEIEDAIEARAVQMLKEKLSGMPEDVKKLVEFATKGGDSMQYMQKVFTAKSSPITTDLDISEPRNQAMMVAYNLALDGYDQDYIQAQIEFLSERGMLSDVATKQFNKWKSDAEAKERKMFEEQQRSVEEQKMQRRKVKSDLSDFLNKNNTVGGMAISAEDRIELPNYMTSREVKMENGAIVTPMQRDLYKVMADRDAAIKLAKLLRSNMDLTGVEQQARTKVVKKLKDNIRRTSGLDNIRSTDSGGGTIQSIADLF